MQQINLKEILNAHCSIDISQKISETETLKSVILDAMKEAAKQALILAAEIPPEDELIYSDVHDYSAGTEHSKTTYKQDILNIINQVI